VSLQKLQHAQWKIDATEKQAKWFIGYAQRQMNRIVRQANK
jgi:hypothetical protein